MEKYMVVQHRIIWCGACLFGALAVALLAAVSHAIDDLFVTSRVELVGYLLLIHAPVLLLLAASPYPRPALGMMLGLVLFGTGVLGSALMLIQWPLPIAPMGGLLLIGSWLWLGSAGWVTVRRLN
jgi:uncharacterized membrane protein YgdD (TMEM256/DUF423 family)